MKYDVAIVGTGPGGFSASVHLARFGKKVCIIEKDILGGTCLNIGCIPTKNLVAARHYLTQNDKLPTYGIRSCNVDFDYNTVKNRLEGIVANRRDNEEKLFSAMNIDYYQGEARFQDPGNIEIKGDDGSSRVVQAENVLLASGSRPVPFPGVDFDGNILNSAGALNLKEIPESFTIIGGGVIGCELAQIFSTFGSKVTIIEALDSIVPLLDKDQRELLTQRLTSQGIRILTGTRVNSIFNRDKIVEVVLNNGQIIQSVKTMICIGRKANTDNLGIDNIDIEMAGDRIVAGRDMRTKIPTIYAAGDIVQGPQVASRGVYEGFIAAENLLGHPREVTIKAFPQCVFTDPQLASVGFSEGEAAENHEIITTLTPFSKNAYAEAYDSMEGFVKIITERDSGKILGVHIAGSAAIDLIGHASMAVNNNFTISQWLDIGLSLPHPSYSEALRDAIRAAYCGSLENSKHTRR